MKCLLVLFCLLSVSCGRVFVPRIPSDSPPLITPNCILPATQSELIMTMDWNDVVKNTPLEGHAPVEVFELQKDVGTDTAYCGSYHWNSGQVQEERKPVQLDRSKTYIMIEIDGLIKIVTYLAEHVFSKFREFLFG